MKIADISDNIRAQLSLYTTNRLLVLDPGPNTGRLGFKNLKPGDTIDAIGSYDRSQTFKDFARRLLAACEQQANKDLVAYKILVVYSSDRPAGAWSTTDVITLTPADLATIRALK